MNPLISRRALGRWITGLLAVRSLPGLAAAPADTPIPLATTRDPVARVFLDAMMENRGVAVFYHGGSTPGALRVFRPECLFRLRPGGWIYARGHCELRGGTRTLRLDRARLA